MDFLQRLINSQRAKRPRVSCGQRLLSGARHGLTRANFLPTPPRLRQSLSPVSINRTCHSFRNSEEECLVLRVYLSSSGRWGASSFSFLSFFFSFQILFFFSFSFFCFFFCDTNARDRFRAIDFQPIVIGELPFFIWNYERLLVERFCL